jgi:hypothetical protein
MHTAGQVRPYGPVVAAVAAIRHGVSCLKGCVVMLTHLKLACLLKVVSKLVLCIICVCLFVHVHGCIDR